MAVQFGNSFHKDASQGVEQEQERSRVRSLEKTYGLAWRRDTFPGTSQNHRSVLVFTSDGVKRSRL